MAFTLTYSGDVAIEQGKATKVTIFVKRAAKPYRNVSLSLGLLPSGITASLAPASGTPNFQSILTISVAPFAVVGTYRFTITGRDAKMIQRMTMSVTVLFSRGTVIEAANYYIATPGNGGSDSNTGTDITHPFATIQKAHDVMTAGQLCYVRGGTYTPSAITTITKDGSSGNLFRMWAYPGETPVWDCSGLTSTSPDVGSGFYWNSANYWHMKGIEVKNAGVHGFYIIGSSSNNIWENLNVHHNAATSTTDGKGMCVFNTAANNLILNCDSHHNKDQSALHDNADGFQLSTSGTGNIIRGCRAYFNSDDGYDFFNVAGNAAWLIDNCWSWRNGYNDDGGPSASGGDGNGFKLGGGSPSGGHTLTRCLAFLNLNGGFFENDADVVMTVYNCTSHNNAVANGGFYFFTTSGHTIRNNIAHGDGRTLNAGTTEDHNTWNGGVTLNDSDFLSVSSTGMDGARASDGSLPTLNYMRLVSGSDLINAGTQTGLPSNVTFLGANPDMGCFERE